MNRSGADLFATSVTDYQTEAQMTADNQREYIESEIRESEKRKVIVA